jgi:hypothetical protein
MPVNILYIDDEAKTKAKRIQQELDQMEGISCKLILPPKITGPDINKIVRGPYDLFLVDQELTTTATYFGSTLVAELRARCPDHPIVIISRTSVLRRLGSQKERQLREEMQSFDALLLKGDVDDRPQEMRHKLMALAEGFRVLREHPGRTWNQLVSAIKAEAEEEDQLREAAPPLQKGRWTVTGAASWLRDVVLGYPGILYDPVHAATRLGITEESFECDEVQLEMKGSKYEGIFATFEGRWWRGRLLSKALELAVDYGLDGPVNKTFGEAIRNKYKIELEPTKCVWDGKPLPDQICYLTHQPVKTQHSLRYYPDNRPSIMDKARVSFRAIRESEDFDEELLDSSGRAMLEKISKLPDPNPEAIAA